MQLIQSTAYGLGKRALATALCTTMFLSAAHAGDYDLGSANRWLVSGSRDNIGAARAFASSLQPDIPHPWIFQTENGWYAITVGYVPTDRAPEVTANLVERGILPPDSFASDGARFVSEIPLTDIAPATTTPSRPPAPTTGDNTDLTGTIVALGFFALMVATFVASDSGLGVSGGGGMSSHPDLDEAQARREQKPQASLRPGLPCRPSGRSTASRAAAFTATMTEPLSGAAMSAPSPPTVAAGAGSSSSPLQPSPPVAGAGVNGVTMMKLDMHQSQRAGRALKEATEHTGGARGALSGAIALALLVSALLGGVGLMLTPAGWMLLLVIGGIAGAFGLFKKAREKLTR